MSPQSKYPPMSELGDEDYARLPSVLLSYPMSPSTLYREIRAGRLPRPEKLSLNVSAWKAGPFRRAMERRQRKLRER